MAAVSRGSIWSATMRRVQSLTGLRFFAALAVMLHHAGLVFFPGAVGRFTFAGYTGVTFFFALSGFVLTWAWRDGAISAFYRKRFARVYPLHFATWVLAIVVGSLVGAVTLDVLPDLTGLTLLQAWIPSQRFSFAGNGPAWSLSCEAFFYAVFPFAIRWAQRRPLSAVVRWLAALAALYYVVVVACAVTGKAGFTLLYINPAGRFVDFAAGVTVGLAVKQGVAAPVRLRTAALLLLALYVLIGALHSAFDITLVVDRFPVDAVFLPFAALLIWSAASRGEGRLGNVLGSTALVKLGEWSFAMYLVQQTILWVIEALHPAAWSVPARLGGEVGFIVVTILLAAVAYVVIERPLERRLRGARPRPEAAAEAVI